MLDRPTFESLYSGQFTFINSVNKSIFCALVILPHYVILRIPENDVYAYFIKTL